MPLNKSVLMTDGIVRRVHKIVNIQHVVGNATFIEVISYQFDDEEEMYGAHTTLTHPFDDGLTMAEAYEWVDQRPEFQEYTSDAETEISELNAQLTEAKATITEQTAAIEQATTELQDTSAKLDTAVSVLTDEQAVTIPQVFPEWSATAYYLVGARVQYNDILYKCLQAHQAQSDWNPAEASSLWTKLHASEIDPSAIEEWEQPDSTNPYMMGDEVIHNGSTWRSTVDNNVWEPGVYGWDMLVTE